MSTEEKTEPGEVLEAVEKSSAELLFLADITQQVLALVEHLPQPDIALVLATVRVQVARKKKGHWY